MRRDLIGLIGCIILGYLGYCAYYYLEPGVGGKINVLKATILGGLAPGFLYSIIMVLGGSGEDTSANSESKNSMKGSSD